MKTSHFRISLVDIRLSNANTIISGIRSVKAIAWGIRGAELKNDMLENIKIKENKIKLSGLANLSQAPKRTNIFCDLTIHNATILDDIDIRGNEDEEKDIIYKLRITSETEINILVENEIITARKKGSQSQKLRQTIREYWEQQASGEIDFEDFYKKRMGEIIKKEANKLL